MRVLIVEDDRKIASFVRKGLEEQGFVVELVRDGDEGLALATSRQYDALVLDIMVPGQDGLAVLKTLRQQGNTVPVVLVTARTGLEDRVEGLNLGADDYLPKPFYLEELVARLHAVMRRATGEKLSLLQSGDLHVNLITREVKRGEQKPELTTREFELLAYLMRSPGRVFPRTQILEHVWGYDYDPESNLVDVNIQRLRKKVDPDGSGRFIETVRGVGYRFRRTGG